MDPVTTVLHKCNAKFSWYAPESHIKSKVTSYLLSITNPLGEKFTINKCNGKYKEGKAMICLVPMKVLTSAPLNFKAGDVISDKI